MNTNRRKFLTSTTALTASAAAGSMLRWGVESAEAQAMGGYKALVCVFLFGGSDSNNMIIPFTDYAQYAAMRTVASNVAITQAQLLQFAPSAGKTYGFHPSFAPLAPTYASGKLAVIANAGTLIQPLTQAQYKNPPPGYVRPEPVLAFGPAERVDGSVAGGAVTTGWGGRAAIRRASGRQRGSLIPVDDFGVRQAAVHHRRQDGAAGDPGNGGVSVSAQGGRRCRRALRGAAGAARHRQDQHRCRRRVVSPQPGAPRQRHGQPDPAGHVARR